jgi:hypothetical protein
VVRDVIIWTTSERVGSAMVWGVEAVEWMGEWLVEAEEEAAAEAGGWPEDRRNPDTKLSRASSP